MAEPAVVNASPLIFLAGAGLAEQPARHPSQRCAGPVTLIWGDHVATSCHTR